MGTTLIVLAVVLFIISLWLCLGNAGKSRDAAIAQVAAQVMICNAIRGVTFMIASFICLYASQHIH